MSTHQTRTASPATTPTQHRQNVQTGTRTMTETTPQSSVQQDTTSTDPPVATPLVLRLRGAHEGGPTKARSRRRIAWAEDVVDNEGMGKKKSKVCCIYHKTRRVGESSSEDDSSSCGSSSDDDDDSSGDEAARRRKGRAGDSEGRGDTDAGSGPSVQPHKHRHKARSEEARGEHAGHVSPNAYERMPKVKHKR